MSKEEGWFHTKSLLITHLKLLVLTLLTEENPDLSQRPDLPGSSSECRHLALGVKTAQRLLIAAICYLHWYCSEGQPGVSPASQPWGLRDSPETHRYFVSRACAGFTPWNRMEFLVRSSSLVCGHLGLCWNVYFKQEKQYFEDGLRIEILCAVKFIFRTLLWELKIS